MQKQLDVEAGRQIIDSIDRLASLEGNAVTSTNDEAEKVGLRAHISKQLFDHAGHLLGCWWAVKNEYEPLCNVFANITNRAAGIMAQRQAAQAKFSEPEPEAAPADPMAKQEGESDLVAPEGAPMILKPNFTGKSKR